MQELSNNQLKEFAKLQQKKYRIEQGKVIVEGIRLIKQLLHDQVEIDLLFVENENDIPSQLSDKTRIYKIKEWQFKKITSTQHPQKIAAVVKTHAQKIISKKFLLYLDDIKEPGNLGTIFRTASAAGIDGIVLSPDCCEIYNPKVMRSSLGTVFTMPWQIENYNWLKEQNANILVSTLHKAENIFDHKLSDRNTILVIGSEANGVHPQIYEYASKCIKIPMFGKLESLNVSVATGIILFHLKHSE